MKIATVATGGIGGFLAVRLTEAGHSVATIARGAHLEAIRRDGLTLTGSDGKTTVQPWMATADPGEVGTVDAVVFAVKGDDLEAAAEACHPLLGADTAVVPFLNGVEAAGRLLEILPAQNVTNGVAYISTTVAGPGIIHQTGAFNRFVFAERDSGASPRIERLREAINDAGSSAPPTEDIEVESWSKFTLFAAVSGITAAARCTMADILGNEALAELFRGAVAETAAVGRSRGVALPETIEADTWAIAERLPAMMRASTAIDLENGRPLEIDWISGAVVRLAESAGMAAPINRTIYGLLSPYRNGKR
jgi:2-dehydropantoate 2-reductase